MCVSEVAAWQQKHGTETPIPTARPAVHVAFCGDPQATTGCTHRGGKLKLELTSALPQRASSAPSDGADRRFPSRRVPTSCGSKPLNPGSIQDDTAAAMCTNPPRRSSAPSALICEPMSISVTNPMEFDFPPFDTDLPVHMASAQGTSNNSNSRNRLRLPGGIISRDEIISRHSESSTCSVASGVDEKAWSECTTAMLRNIPGRCTTEELLEEMAHRGFKGKVDFFYLPIDFKSKRNKNYAFINFCTPEQAFLFRKVFQDTRLRRYTSKKILEVSAATTQGFRANVLGYLKTQAGRVQNRWFRPIIFRNDEQSQQDESPNNWMGLPLIEDNLPEDLLLELRSTKTPEVAGSSNHARQPCGRGKLSERLRRDGASEEDVAAMISMQGAVQKFLQSIDPNFRDRIGDEEQPDAVEEF